MAEQPASQTGRSFKEQNASANRVLRQMSFFFDKCPASPDIQTKEIWIYDFRTNVHFTLV